MPSLKRCLQVNSNRRICCRALGKIIQLAALVLFLSGSAPSPMLKVQGAGALYVLKRLEQMPQVSADDRAKPVDGAGQDLDTTLRHLELTLCQRRNPSVTSRCQIYSPEATS